MSDKKLATMKLSTDKTVKEKVSVVRTRLRNTALENSYAVIYLFMLVSYEKRNDAKGNPHKHKKRNSNRYRQTIRNA